MNKVIDKGFRSCRFVSTIVKHPVLLKLSGTRKNTFYITAFVISCRFHLCQNFELHALFLSLMVTNCSGESSTVGIDELSPSKFIYETL